MNKIKRIIEIEEETYSAIFTSVSPNIPLGWTAIKESKPYDNSGDCISRSALKGVIETYRPALITNDLLKGKNNMIDYCIAEIDNAPTVDAIVNTIEVRPQGEWLDESKDSLLCTCCKKRVYKPFIGGFPTERSQHYYPNFCAFCGADMRKGGAE